MFLKLLKVNRDYDQFLFENKLDLIEDNQLFYDIESNVNDMTFPSSFEASVNKEHLIIK